jgi:hypothetical protein
MSEKTESPPEAPIGKLYRCSSCHWWFAGFGTDDRRVCVCHTGMKTAEVRKVDFGGSKPMRTTGDFGCIDWSEDKRKGSR